MRNNFTTYPCVPECKKSSDSHKKQIFHQKFSYENKNQTASYHSANATQDILNFFIYSYKSLTKSLHTPLANAQKFRYHKTEEKNHGKRN
jgi:hypothetical protein